MTADLVPVDNAALTALDPASREGAVTQYLTRARDQLALAVEMTGPAAVAALKAEIAVAAEATKQLGLSKEIQMDAQEMVRRAEFALGKAVRAGQDRGEIRTTGQAATRYDQAGLPRGVIDPARRLENASVAAASPTDFLPSSEERVAVYALVDGVTEPQFEAALSEAKAEGNASRANVVRKIKGVASDRLSPTEKLAKIAELADTGMTSGQIATEIGAGEAYVRNAARQNGIKITADEVLRGTHRLKVDHNHIVSHLVMTLEVVTEGLERVDFAALDDTQVQNWADSLTTTSRALNRFVKQMKESTQ